MDDRRKLFASAIGVGSGAAGLAASAACAGGACLSCFGCAAVGAGVLLAALVGARGTTAPGVRPAMASDAAGPHGLTNPAALGRPSQGERHELA